MIDLQRDMVLQEARSWLGTPYRHRGAIKGSGVDCARILIEVYGNVGLIEKFDPGRYTRDWHLHRNEEVYLQTVERFAGEPLRSGDTLIEWLAEGYKPLTGDIIVWRVGRTFSHSAIVTEWPYAIHASAPAMVVEEVQVYNTPVHKLGLPVRHYSLWRAT